VSTLQTLGIFLGIPIALAAVIWFAVMASGWGKVKPEDADSEAGPLFVVSDGPTPDPARVHRMVASSPNVTGGAHGSW
jgi:hypothetical protein